MEYWSPLMFVFAALAVMAIIERIADAMHASSAAAQAKADAIFKRWQMFASINSTYGKFGSYPIAKDNTGGEPGGSNRGINTRSRTMNTARHEFNSIQAARAFYVKARANRMTRHGYYACADSLKARLVQHGHFVIGSVTL